MSKLSLSKRLFGNSGKDPPMANPPQPLIVKNRPNASPAKQDPATAQVGSPLSGWSNDSDGGRESPPQNLPMHEPVEHPPDAIENDNDIFYAVEEDPLLNELYDTYDGDLGDCDGDDCDGGVYSENEEEQEEVEDDSEEEEDYSNNNNNEDEVMDLCDSPSPHQLGSNETETEEEVAVVEALEQHRACDVCGIELASMHYLQQVQHVKQCLSKRHLAGGLAKPPNNTTNNNHTALTTAKTTSTKRKYLEMDIRDWLQELEFDPFIDKFIAEEIDMTLVHALNEDDLSLLGITNLLQQRKFIRAAKKVGEELPIKRIKRAAAVAASMKKSTGIDQRQKKKQKTLQELGVSTTTTTTTTKVNTNSSTNNNVKLAEQALLLNLYPANHNNDGSRYSVLAPPAQTNGAEEAPLSTPLLPPTTALASARVPPSSSLFTSAAHCKQVTDTLEARIEKRRSERPAGSTDTSSEQLGRGGITFSRVEESKALKVMKLQALKEELRTHESTVAELKRLIAGLEADILVGQ